MRFRKNINQVLFAIFYYIPGVGKLLSSRARFIRSGWSNFCTLVGHFLKLFEFAGLNRLKTLIFVPNSGFSLKKKGLPLESIFEIPIFVPKS